jgi:hypothetical protein
MGEDNGIFAVCHRGERGRSRGWRARRTRGSIVADARGLWSHRVVEIVAAPGLVELELGPQRGERVVLMEVMYERQTDR